MRGRCPAAWQALRTNCRGVSGSVSSNRAAPAGSAGTRPKISDTPRGPFLSSPVPLLLLRAPKTLHPCLESRWTSPDPPQAGHAPVPPHLSQSPSYPARIATPISTPVPLHALHSPSPSHSVQGVDGAAVKGPHSAVRTSSINGSHSRFHVPPLLRQPVHFKSTYQRGESPSRERSHPVLCSHSPQAGHSLRRPSSFSL